MCYPLRLQPEQEIRTCLLEHIKTHHLKAAFILTCVGSVTQATIRLANADEIIDIKGPFEIVSLVGTLSGGDGGHLHISLSDVEGKVIGGHVIGNLIVHTTAEILIGECKHTEFNREMDSQTGYDELVVKSRS
ncbi:hypothetical protein LOTGIDRAFT_110886 [Lottia gigantea]|uniref:PPC domain-containing protein n=1 Tax=Lottia gigantea TaxID=225164 RepID=V4AFT0_LOTGI|nr:hypothetical protein LOTGIDRAFT_110886 [Lottia gigantea]ESP02859.1 hypothetical protein LOTGIDRAFT_110886 [Lottia gigantea]